MSEENKNPKKNNRFNNLASMMNKASTNNKQQSGLFTGISEINIEDIEVNPFQPRKVFNEEKLQELATSILTHGLIHPVTVVKKDDGKYTLLAGERRLRAHKINNFETIKVYVFEDDDVDMELLALVENIQRDDLCVIDEAVTLEKLYDRYKSIQKLSDSLGYMKKTHTARFLNIAKFNDEAKQYIRENALNQPNLLETIVKQPESNHLTLLEELHTTNKLLSLSKSQEDNSKFKLSKDIPGIGISSSKQNVKINVKIKDFTEEKVEKLLKYIEQL